MIITASSLMGLDGNKVYRISNVDISVDGKVEDWKEVKKISLSETTKDLDIKSFSMTQDKDNVYFYIECDPSISNQFKKTQQTGNVCELYFDFDKNDKTGCEVKGCPVEMKGFENSVIIQYGIYFENGGKGVYVSYDLNAVDKKKNKLDIIDTQDSQYADDLIKLDKKIVEFAIPKKKIQFGKNTKWRMVFVESNITSKKGYYEFNIDLEVAKKNSSPSEEKETK